MEKVKSEDANKGIGTSKYFRIDQFVSGLSGFFKSLGHGRFQTGKLNTEMPLNSFVNSKSSDAVLSDLKQRKSSLGTKEGTIGGSGATKRATTFYLP